MRKVYLLLVALVGFLLLGPQFFPVSSSSGQWVPGQATLVGNVNVLALPGASLSQTSQGPGVNAPLEPQGSLAFNQSKAQVGGQGFVPPGESTKTVVSPSGVSPLTVTPNLVLEGASGGSPNPCGCSPPDPNAGVGPNHVFEMVNLAGIIYNKDGTLAKSTFSLYTFFSLSTSKSLSDPQVFYDAISGRWFASIIDISDLSLQIAVSTSSDPTGTFNLYSISTGSHLPDQPFIGTSDDKFVISANDFNTAGTSYQGVQYWVLNKSEMVSGASTIDLVASTPDTTMFTLRPVRHLTSTSVFYMVTNCLSACVSSSSLTTTSASLLALTGVPPGPVTVTSNTFSIATSTSPPDAQQPGTSTLLATNDNRILSATWEANNLWLSWNDACVPSGDTMTRSCVRLIELTTAGTGAPAKNQDFDYSSNAQYFFYPAVSLYQGQLAVVYGQSSTTFYPSLLVTGRLPTDPTNTLQAPATIRTGIQPDISTRYGDYFSAATDPTATSTSTFWVTGEYRASSVSSSWNTAIARVSSLEYSSGLVGYWPLDEGTGTKAYDLSGNGNAGTLVNSPTWMSSANCKFGDCLNFTGSNYVHLGAGEFDTLTSGTVLVWVNLPSYHNWQEFFSHYNNGNNRIILEDDMNGILSWDFVIAGSYSCGIDYVTSTPLHQWVFLAASFGPSGLALYQNGVLVSSDATKTCAFPDIGASTDSYFGHQGAGAYLSGSLDDIRIYNRALLANEIQALYYSSPNYPQPSSSIRVLSDQINTANSAASTRLTASVSANMNYVFTASFYVTNTLTSSVNFQIHALPAGATLVMACGINGAVAITSGDCVTTTGTNILGTSIPGTTATNIAITIYGTIAVGSTAGTLQIDFLDVSAMGTVTVKAGSFMILSPVA
jgi:Concanavalin A-like lectin/glucanases superfamily